MFVTRLGRAREMMATENVDVLMLSVGSNMPYFCGYEAMPLERLTMLVVPRDAEGLRISAPERNLGLRGLPTGSLELERVELAPEARLGGEAGRETLL